MFGTLEILPLKSKVLETDFFRVFSIFFVTLHVDIMVVKNLRFLGHPAIF